MTARKLPAVAYHALKAAYRRLVDLAGGLESSATTTRVSKTSLGYYCQATHDQHMPGDAIADLEADVGEPVVTRELARLAGYELVPIGGRAETGDIVVLTLRLDASTAAVSEAVAEMETDGRREVHELDAVCEALRTAIGRGQAALDAVQRVRQQLAGGPVA
jgi:hypothetical protein